MVQHEVTFPIADEREILKLRARDDADRGDRGGRLGGADARVPLEVPRQGLWSPHRRHRRPRQLALPRRAVRRPGEAEGALCPPLATDSWTSRSVPASRAPRA